MAKPNMFLCFTVTVISTCLYADIVFVPFLANCGTHFSKPVLPWGGVNAMIKKFRPKRHSKRRTQSSMEHSSCCLAKASTLCVLARACPAIISRAEWGARATKSVQYLPKQPVPYAFIHHSSGTECFNKTFCAQVVRGYQDFHMDVRGWDDIGYSFVIGGDGSVFEGRGWDRVGAHTLSYNSVGLGFCLAGDFMTHLPTQIQMDTAKELIACGVSLGKLSTNYTLRGHRDMVPTTSCPGDQFYALIKTWDHYY